MFIVYAVYNSKHDKIYIGQTIDLNERIKLHNDHYFTQSYTSRFDGEWRLIYSEQVVNRSQALIREKQLKSFEGREFIRKYISPVAQR